ncbi:MAG: hypothetical protein KDE56_03570 [Anaerolineales bacterium]|nr:hypothetical protein [Anaerolineales bacterium]
MFETDQQKAAVQAWDEELRAKHNNRWFASLLFKQGETVFQRFSGYYSQLTALPRRTRRTLQRKWAVTLAAAAMAFALSGAPNINVAQAAADIMVDGKNCTLMDAITAANTDAVVGGCDGSSSDTLVLTKDIVLKAIDNSDFGNSGTPVITSNITIQGNGHKIKRDGKDPFRILTVANGAQLTLNNSVITGGLADVGGGILVHGGTLYMDHSTVSGNDAETSGGGIALVGNGSDVKYSSALILSSVVEKNAAGENGGGIAAMNGGFVLAVQSTISGNEAGLFGGGMAAQNYSVAWSKYSTIADNTAVQGGGGIASVDNSFLIVGASTVSGNEATDPDSSGGGVLSIGNFESKYAIVVNSTIARNEAGFGGGVSNYSSGMGILASTIAGNSASQEGGGIWNDDSDMGLFATIVSGNSASNGAEVVNNGSLDSEDNLFGHSGISSGQAFAGFTPDGTDFVATSDANNVALGSIIDTSGSNPRLRDNGGPTLTIALVPGSPAIDGTGDDRTGDDFVSLDQRGFVRDTNADIGAYEFDSEARPAVCDAPPIFNGPVNIIHGTEGNDKIKGTSGNDIIIGYGGNDRLEGLGGNDCIIGNAGDDQLYGDEGNDILWGGDLDNVTVYSSKDRDKIYGDAGDDEMHGGGDKDRLDGNDGDDVMYGDDGDDTMVAHDGNDTMYGGSGKDNMRGDDGNDSMYGEAGDDKLYGRQGDDVLDGGDNNDQLDGSDGTDTCTNGEQLKSCEA